MGILKALLLSMSMLSLIACSPPVEKEVRRILSPDGIVEAVIIEAETDATVATPTKIYIVPKGSKTEGENPILIADRFELKKISWHQKNLIIEFSAGRIFDYQNFWLSGKVNNFNYDIKIFLKDANFPE